MEDTLLSLQQHTPTQKVALMHQQRWMPTAVKHPKDEETVVQVEEECLKLFVKRLNKLMSCDNKCQVPWLHS